MVSAATHAQNVSVARVSGFLFMLDFIFALPCAIQQEVYELRLCMCKVRIPDTVHELIGLCAHAGLHLIGTIMEN